MYTKSSDTIMEYPCTCMLWPKMPELARAYVPFQCLSQIYPPMQGLNQGTIFPQLDKAYETDLGK